MRTALLWLRRDLRLTDHPALHAALASGRRVVAVYIHSPEESAPWTPGAASHWWLHHSLQALDQALQRLGSRLIVRSGPSLQALQTLLQETGADAVYWSRQYEPAHAARDEQVESALRALGVSAEGYPGSLLGEPAALRTDAGEVYRVFTPYWRKLSQCIAVEAPLPAPARLDDPVVASLPLEQLALLPRLPWASEFSVHATPGERGARESLELFQDDAARQYLQGRDRPDRAGTSRLSAHLHFGEISPRQIIHALVGAGVSAQRPSAAWQQHEGFIRQLGWRNFAHQLLHHFPQTPEQPLYSKWATFGWREDASDLRCWQRGHTGIPIVDAGMRQLWRHGWMHNRVRMIVASLLTKNLRLHWLHGARWFWDTLVDADLANNTMGWQWSAGCGADAAPYFRIFNPVTQAEKFDPDGTYVREFVPELARLSGAAIHKPWTVGGVRGYPQPVVDLQASRSAALAAFTAFRSETG